MKELQNIKTEQYKHGQLISVKDAERTVFIFNKWCWLAQLDIISPKKKKKITLNLSCTP
jgi:hypothetical protein